LEQGRNKRNNHIIEYKGKRATISTFAAEYSLPKGRIRTRLSYGWSVEDAIEIPPSKSLKYWERVSLDDLDL
jgi:hypothetical protein